jgi:hypothetical protein
MWCCSSSNAVTSPKVQVETFVKGPKTDRDEKKVQSSPSDGPVLDAVVDRGVLQSMRMIVSVDDFPIKSGGGHKFDTGILLEKIKLALVKGDMTADEAKSAFYQQVLPLASEEGLVKMASELTMLAEAAGNYLKVDI